MYRIDLQAMGVVEGGGAEVLSRHRAKAAPSWWEQLWPRLLVGGAWLVLVLFTYVLLSFHNPLQPAVTTTEAVLVVVLLGLVAARA